LRLDNEKSWCKPRGIVGCCAPGGVSLAPADSIQYTSSHAVISPQAMSQCKT